MHIYSWPIKAKVVAYGWNRRRPVDFKGRRKNSPVRYKSDDSTDIGIQGKRSFVDVLKEEKGGEGLCAADGRKVGVPSSFIGGRGKTKKTGKESSYQVKVGEGRQKKVYKSKAGGEAVVSDVSSSSNQESGSFKVRRGAVIEPIEKGKQKWVRVQKRKVRHQPQKGGKLDLEKGRSQKERERVSSEDNLSSDEIKDQAKFGVDLRGQFHSGFQKPNNKGGEQGLLLENGSGSEQSSEEESGISPTVRE
ncbi:hypothetical protein Q3G72_016823 [Acer saccharum]|nr:hypothetical protein Q3G72_016823 [Acer saccharum]